MFFLLYNINDYAFKKVIATLDTFYVVTSGGLLYRRTGITSKQPTGTGWENQEFRGVRDVARTNKQLVVLLNNGTLLYKNGMTNLLFFFVEKWSSVS